MQEPPSLTLANVETALQCLTTGSVGIKEAENALLSWQRQQVNAYTQALLYSTLNPHVRLAALLSLKAVVKQSWKDRGRSGTYQLLDEPTRQQVRTLLLSIVATGDNPLVRQEAIDVHYRNQYNLQSVIQNRTVQAAATACLVQVALYDLPKQSLDLIPILVSHVLSSQSDHMQKRNAMYALEAILADLSQKRLLGVKQYMRAVAVKHIAELIQAGVRLVASFSSLDSTLVEMCLLLVRSIHYLLQSSLATLMENDALIASVDQWMKLILDCSYAVLSEGLGMHPQLSCLCETLWELVVHVQDAHPIAFARYLEGFLNMYYTVILLGIDETMSSVSDIRVFLNYYEKRILEPSLLQDELTILALRFVTDVASCTDYAPEAATNAAIPILQSDELRRVATKITSKGDACLRASDVQHAVHVVWSSFFSEERTRALGDVCVCYYMTMAQAVIDEWETDPEAFIISEGQRTADDNVSSAAEMLFCSLVESSISRRIVLGRLVALLNDSESQMGACRHEIGVQPPGDRGSLNNVTPSVILWEAVYTAAGLSAADLDDFSGWEFLSWYRSTLDPCLRLLLTDCDGAQAVPLLRRRILWLIGCNTSRLSRDTSTIKYMTEIISTGTSAHNDIAVKLSAVQVLSAAVANFDEAAEDCVSQGEVIISSLYRLANECREVDSQSSILDVIPIILAYISGTGRDVTAEVANASVIPIPSIWDGSIGESVILRRNLISVLAVVAPSLGYQGIDGLFPIALPIIASSLDPERRRQNSVLIDEALLLWLTILRFAGTYTASIGALFPFVVGLLEDDFEHLRMAMLIAEANIILGRQIFLASNAEYLCAALHLTVAKVRQRGAKYVGLVLEALLRELPVDGGVLLLRGNVLETMVRACALSYVNDKQREPDRVISLYLTSLARVLFASPGLIDYLLPLEIGSGRGDSFNHSELVRLYIRMMNLEPNCFFLSIWMKFLCCLCPRQSCHPESALSVAFFSEIDEFLRCCLSIAPKLMSDNIPDYYQFESDEDEETINLDHERRETMLQRSASMDTLGSLKLQESIFPKLANHCKSFAGKVDEELLEALRKQLVATTTKERLCRTYDTV